MTWTNCDLFTHSQSRSYSNHLVKKSLVSNHEYMFAEMRSASGDKEECVLEFFCNRLGYSNQSVNQLTLFNKKIAVCSEIHTQRIT